MPYISVKLFPGRSREAKEAFALAVRQAAVDLLNADSQYVTVSVQDVDPSVWKEQVFAPEIVGNPHLILRHNKIVPPCGAEGNNGTMEVEEHG